jgi:hypothetical protein
MRTRTHGSLARRAHRVLAEVTNMEQTQTREASEASEFEAIVARATREADLAMAIVTREGVDAVETAIETKQHEHHEHEHVEVLGLCG